MFQANQTINSSTLFDYVPSPIAPLFTVALSNGFETVEHHNLTEREAIALRIAIEQVHGTEGTDARVLDQYDEVLITDSFTVGAIAGLTEDHYRWADFELWERGQRAAQQAEQLAYDVDHYVDLITAVDRKNAEVDSQYDFIAQLERQVENAKGGLQAIKDERDELERRLTRVHERP